MVKSSCPCNKRTANINDRCIVGMSNDPGDPDPYFYPQTCRGQKLTVIQDYINMYATQLVLWQGEMKKYIETRANNSALSALQTQVDEQARIIKKNEFEKNELMLTKPQSYEGKCLRLQTEIYTATDEEARVRTAMCDMIHKSSDTELQKMQGTIDTCITHVSNLKHDYAKRQQKIDATFVPNDHIFPSYLLVPRPDAQRGRWL